jgi:phytol kinase
MLAPVCFVCFSRLCYILFALILFLSLRFNLLRSINDIDRVSHGSLLYPLAVYGCFLGYNYHGNQYIYFYLPVLTMAICDPIAATFGKRWPYGKFYIKQGKKTLVGSLSFFVAAVALTVALFHLLSLNGYPSALIIASLAVAATLAEAVSVKGLDNITIPISVVLVLTLWHV